MFIPILFMGGILGRLFREFAVTITTAILISGVVSVTLTPMLCSRFLRVVHSKTGFAGFMDRTFERLLDGYKRSLGLVLRHRLVMLGVFAAVLFATVRMFGIVPKGFIPDCGQRLAVRQAPAPPREPRSTRWSATRSGSPTWSSRIPMSTR